MEHRAYRHHDWVFMKPKKAEDRGVAKGLSTLTFALLAVLLGVAAGVGAAAFRALIALVHNGMFAGRLSVIYDTNQHAPPSVWGPFALFVPVVGATAVVFLVKHFAPEAKGHGVPEVMDAIYYQQGVIRPLVAVIKSLASSISIGSGGSVGREGPIIQIGSAFASWVGRSLHVSRWQLITLVAAGGGAGIAATFNTPIGGVLFAVEVLLHEVSVRTLVPVALATGTATYVSHFFFGAHPAFEVPALSLSHVSGAMLLPAFVGLGCLMAVVSAAFIKALYATEDRFEKWIPRHDYVRHALGMLGVGGLGVALHATLGHYHVFGVGYATIMDVLSGTLTSMLVLVTLFALKLLATSLTLGSGASGGVFSPSLFMGATLGGAYGLALRRLFPWLNVDPAALALAGMAGVVGGATGAALTAIVMTFEMTLDYTIVLPMTLTVATSYGLRRLILRESIYTMKLVRRGHTMPQALQTNAHLVHLVGEIMQPRLTVLPVDAPVERLALDGPDSPAHIVLVDGAKVAGVVEREWARCHPARVASARTVADLAHVAFITVTSDSTLFDVLARLGEGVSVAVVLSGDAAELGIDGSQVRGLVTKEHLADVIATGMKLFGD
jgi:chloride channel protein, CIC family